VCVRILALVTRHANRNFYALYYIVICGLPGFNTFFHLTSQKGLFFWGGDGGDITAHKICCWYFLQLLVETFLIV